MGGRMNTTTLKNAGIEIQKNVATLEELEEECPQARRLAQYLLDFRQIVSHERWEELRQFTKALSKKEIESLRMPEAPDRKARRATKRDFEKRYRVKHQGIILNRAFTIKEEADKIQSKDEKKWTRLLENHVFKRWIDKATDWDSPEYVHRAEDAFNRFRAESEHTWTFGKGVLEQYCQETPDTAPKLTAPKPDLFFSFHAYMKGDPGCGPLTGDDYIESFGVTCLSKLYEDYVRLSEHHDERPFGFFSSPSKEFYTKEYANDSFKDRICFPWAVCEWKHHGHIGTRHETFLHCQAANAAAVCLTYLANAASGGYPAPDLLEIRPVVCMTFAGPKTRVWVAYVTEVEDGRFKYRMQCIWKGSLKNVLDNIKLCVIIENLHFWAVHHLRPWLFSCIQQWTLSIAWMEDNASDSSAGSDSGPNFAFRRADTLDDFLDRDDDSDRDDASYVGSEGLNYDEEEVNDEEEENDDDDDEDDDYDDDDDEDEVQYEDGTRHDDVLVTKLRLKVLREDMKMLERRLYAASLG